MNLLQKVFIIMFLLLSLSTIRAQERKVNWGVKAGFTSSLFLVSDFTIGNVNIKEVQNNYKIGYTSSIFMRVNWKRHFLQPELSYNVDRCDITFDKPQSDDFISNILPAESATISSSIHSIELPVTYGYNFIKEGPYSLAVFGGPKLRYILSGASEVEYDNFNLRNIREELHPLNISFTMGVAVTVERIFLDFRYDIGLHNLSKHVAYDADDYNAPIRFKRRNNVLSFSLGVFF